MTQAILNGVVIADAPQSDLIKIEGNWYFPPSSVKKEYLVDSGTPYTCPWKGVCQYFSVKDGDSLLQDRAWCYPHPLESAFARTDNKNFSGYVAFWKEVQVTD